MTPLSHTPKSIILAVVIFSFLQIIISSAIIYVTLITQTQNYLRANGQWIQEDIRYKNGHWDLFNYNADSRIPETYPLYIISLDGFVIDRWRPVHGFLDKSNISRLLTFQTPQTIHTVTDENWRIFSEPIIDNDKTIGVITVSKFNPDSDNISKTDALLRDNAKYIHSKLVIHNATIDISHLDIRDIDYNIAYEVVDQFNTVLVKNNNASSIDHLPDYIDRSLE